MALFVAHFSKGLDISVHEVLLNISENIGLDKNKVKSVLKNKLFENIVRKIEREVKKQDINAVPSYIFNKQY